MADHFWGTEIPGVRVLDVEIQGSWDYSQARWTGVVRSSGQLVAMAFANNQGQTESYKSNDPDTDTLPVDFHLLKRAPDSLDATSYFHIGSAMLAAYSVMPDRTHLPEIPDRRVVQTGRVLRLVNVEGEPEIEFGALFLAREDVKFMRKHIWRLRKELIADVPQPWAAILTCGRHGLLQISS